MANEAFGPIGPSLVNLNSSKIYTFLRRESDYVFYRNTDPAIFAEIGEISVLEAGNEDRLKTNVEGYQPNTPASQNGTNATNSGGPGSSSVANPPAKDRPHDPRLAFIPGNSPNTVLSMTASFAESLMEGFLVPEDPHNPKSSKISAQNVDDIKTVPGHEQFLGIPSLMNPNAYISFQSFKAPKNGNYYQRIFDQENQARWYDVAEANADRQGRYKAPTVTEIVAWSNEPSQVDRQPYRFQDFAYCKYWQLIPNNYLVTLRRYPYPTVDNLQVDGEGTSEGALSTKDRIAIRPVATAITWLGEATGNKMSSIIGGIESGLNWKEIKATLNEVQPATPGDAGNGPQAGIAKWLGIVAGDSKGGADRDSNRTPPDPYTQGPWLNKIIGPINVIDSVKGRERGLKFKHDISLVFEYSARSIGGINTKAAMLDIMANLLMMTSASASFWGGANRFMPGSSGNTAPFLGGPNGRAAWLKGDPVGFLNAVTSQFAKAASAISDFLFSATQDPIEALKSLVAGGAKVFMNEKNGSKAGYVTGLKAILTGEPVGEWHLTIGNPFNPIMMIGNLICNGIKIEFNDELGPDDFPTELKATITLEHGRPRDRDAIESMFNAGSGRLYSLPPGYEKTISSLSVTAVDKPTSQNATKATKGKGTGRKGKKPTSKSELVGNPQDVNQAINSTTTTANKLYSNIAAKWSHGWTKTPPPPTK